MRDRPLSIDLYCRVVDNFGDAGVCWRLARQLARERGHRLRLVIDRPEYVLRLAGETRAASTQAAMRVEGVDVFDWTRPPGPGPGERGECADVAIAAFQCELPESTRSLVDRPPRDRPPLWINLDYLSAEPWVDTAHGLPSVKPSGATEWFFLPGFTAASGGLIRERPVTARLRATQPAARAPGQGSANAYGLAQALRACRPDALRVSIFCYEDQPLQWLDGQRADLIVTAGCNQDEVRRQFGAPDAASVWDAGAARLIFMPWLEQDGYDALLAACDLNFVRGEDSWIRAIWAARPFVWRPYPQSDGADVRKLHAFLDRLLAGFTDEDATIVRGFMTAYQSLLPAPQWLRQWVARRESIAEAHAAFTARLSGQDDLASRLEAFIDTHML